MSNPNTNPDFEKAFYDAGFRSNSEYPYLLSMWKHKTGYLFDREDQILRKFDQEDLTYDEMVKDGYYRFEETCIVKEIFLTHPDQIAEFIK